MFDKKTIISKKYCICQEKFNAGQGDVNLNATISSRRFSKTKNSMILIKQVIFAKSGAY